VANPAIVARPAAARLFYFVPDAGGWAYSPETVPVTEVDRPEKLHVTDLDLENRPVSESGEAGVSMENHNNFFLGPKLHIYYQFFLFCLYID
jgi:hypothetical protein